MTSIVLADALGAPVGSASRCRWSSARQALARRRETQAGFLEARRRHAARASSSSCRRSSSAPAGSCCCAIRTTSSPPRRSWSSPSTPSWPCPSPSAPSGPHMTRPASATTGSARSSASPAGTGLRLIDWPVLRRPLATGFAFAMALSLGDLGVIALFGSDSVQTLPYLLLARMGSYRTDDAAGLALLLGLLCLALVFLADRFGKETDALNRRSPPARPSASTMSLQLWRGRDAVRRRDQACGRSPRSWGRAARENRRCSTWSPASRRRSPAGSSSAART